MPCMTDLPEPGTFPAMPEFASMLLDAYAVASGALDRDDAIPLAKIMDALRGLNGFAFNPDLVLRGNGYRGFHDASQRDLDLAAAFEILYDSGNYRMKPRAPVPPRRLDGAKLLDTAFASASDAPGEAAMDKLAMQVYRLRPDLKTAAFKAAGGVSALFNADPRYLADKRRCRAVA